MLIATYLIAAEKADNTGRWFVALGYVLLTIDYSIGALRG